MVQDEVNPSLNLWIRDKAMQIPSMEAYEIVHKTYIYAARYSFDDFMIAMEWNRTDNARFWLPRRSVLEGKHHIATKIQNFLNDKSRYLSISMPPGTGKLLANDTQILTSKGFKNHGDLKVGDQVIGLDGEFKKVTHVFPKGVANRKVTFSNGETVLCHENHEWLLYDRNLRREVVLETKQLKGLDNAISGRGHRYRYMLPKHDYLKGKRKNLLDPYTLGVWLGDGANRKPVIANPKCDFDMIKKIMNSFLIPAVYEHKDTHVMYYSFEGLRKELKKYGMCYRSETKPKHIPEEYLTASVEQRLELLAGLLDSDGTLSGSKYIFSTTEPLLKDGFIKLISTFGWRACVSENEPMLSSSGIQGRKTCYVISFTPDCKIPCVLKRKQNIPHKQRRLSIVSVEPVEETEGNCIEVEGGIYLVGKTLIPTHNSTLIKFLLAYQIGLNPRSANMYISYASGMTKLIFDSVVDMITSDEYDFDSIFDIGKPVISSEYMTISYRRKGDAPTLGLVSIGGQVTGRTRANNLFVTDDLVKGREEASSPERLEKLWNEYNATLTTRMIGNCKQIQLGTIWSIHDPISKMKLKHENDKKYHFISIPVKDEEGHSNFKYDHPDRYTDERIQEIEHSLDPVDFSCLYMQRGIEKEGLAFTNLNFYNGVLPDGNPDNIVFVCDVAWGGGDYLCMPICYVYGERRFIVDVIYDKSDKTKTKPRVVGKILAHGIKMGQFEANAGGDEYCEDVEKELRIQNYRLNLSSKRAPVTVRKTVRIEQFAPDIREYYYLAPQIASTEYNKFLDSLQSFSFTAKNLHDDAPDAMAMLSEYLMAGVKSIKAVRNPFM